MELAGLIALFSLKHFLADFVIQTNWVARGKEARVGWLVPLTAHVATHAAMTLVISLAVAPQLWWIALVDFAVHFAIDRAKTLVSQATGWPVEDARFWWLMGFDQFLHQLTNIGLALLLVTR